VVGASYDNAHYDSNKDRSNNYDDMFKSSDDDDDDDSDRGCDDDNRDYNNDEIKL